MSRATETQLAALHGAVFTAMTEELDRQRDAGKIEPQFLNQLLKFLKDNGISSEMTKAQLTNLLPSVSAPIIDDLDDDHPLNGYN